MLLFSNRFSPFLLIALYRFLRAFSCTNTLRKLNWLELLQISLNEDKYFKKLERLSKKLQTYPVNSDILIPHKEFLPLTVLQQYAAVQYRIQGFWKNLTHVEMHSGQPV